VGLPAPLDWAPPRTLALWLTEPLSWSLPPPMLKTLCLFWAPVSSAAFRKQSYRPWSWSLIWTFKFHRAPLLTVHAGWIQYLWKSISIGRVIHDTLVAGWQLISFNCLQTLSTTL